MAPSDEYLGNVYNLGHGTELQRYYDRWADSYDAELDANGYRTPQRCADALARHAADHEAPVLDFACGTGLSGRALREAGFGCIDGMDLSPGMLARASETGIYRNLLQAEVDRPFDIRGQGYAAVVASGAIGPGAAPASSIDAAISGLERGGLFVFSLNDKALADPDFGERPLRAVETGHVEILEAEDGEHLPGLDLSARVLVLRRL